jgi:hypothetical protein
MPTNMPIFSSCTFPPKILLEHHEQEGLNGILTFCGWWCPCVLSQPFIAISLYFKCSLNEKTLKVQGSEPQTYIELALDTSLTIHHILQFWWWRAYLYMVVGFAGISLMSPLVCVYDFIINSSLEVVMEQLQLVNVNLCSRGVCVNKHHMHVAHLSM